MPELPEAETIVRGLAGRLPGRTIEEVRITHADVVAPLSAAAFREHLRGRTITAVQRRAKKIVLATEGDLRLVVSLGMTGRLVLSSAPRPAELAHVAVRFDLDDGEVLFYDDARRFGRLEVHQDEQSWGARQDALGVEPLGGEFTAQHLYALAQRSRTPIRNWLLDQRRVAGIGNIYASEALFRAGIHPLRPANALSRAEAARLRDELRAVLGEAIDSRGTTFSDYRDERGEAGGYAMRLKVYGREGEPCPVCGTPVQRGVSSNRSYFFCPACQKPPSRRRRPPRSSSRRRR